MVDTKWAAFKPRAHAPFGGNKKRPPNLSAGVSHHAKNTSSNLLNLQIDLQAQ
jgi:hypothetical protein